MFYDGTTAGNGVRMQFRINQNLQINGTTVSMKNVQPNEEYYYLISYKVADDYSKVTVRIRVETESGTLLGDQTMDLTSLVGADSIETWVKANKKLLIDAQQCSFSVASVWSSADIQTFGTVNDLNTAIAALDGSENNEELNALKEQYDALPFAFKYLVTDIAKLNEALAA